MEIALEARSADRIGAATSDPPFDFGAFVAERRGIARDEAEALIASWVASYEPMFRSLSSRKLQGRARSGASEPTQGECHR